MSAAVGGVGFVGDDTDRSCHCVSISAIPGMPAVDIEASNRYVKRAGESFCLWVVGAPYIRIRIAWLGKIVSATDTHGAVACTHG